MTSVTTAQILCDRALQKTCGRQCVDWAIGMIEAGHETDSLLQLVGLLQPYNHFEIQALTDRALAELGIVQKSPEDSAFHYAAEVLGAAIAGKVDLLEAVAIVKQLHIELGYPRELSDFYRLHFASRDLQEYDFQWYWHGATKENIEDIVRDRAIEFIRNQARE